MLHGRHADSLLLQSRGHARVANAKRRGRQVHDRIQIHATKHDTRIRRSRAQAQFHFGAGMKADADGIDEMVLFPSFAMCVPSIGDPSLGAGIARMYNEWAAALVAEGQGRLHAAAVVPIEHGDVALTVLGEAKELGLCCSVVPPALATRNLDHPDLARFFSAAAI